MTEREWIIDRFRAGVDSLSRHYSDAACEIFSRAAAMLESDADEIATQRQRIRHLLFRTYELEDLNERIRNSTVTQDTLEALLEEQRAENRRLRAELAAKEGRK